VSNQGGIESGFVNICLFENKLHYIESAILDFTSVFTLAVYCASNDKKDPRRKPNTGMLEYLFEQYNAHVPPAVGRKDCLMIGDASGKEGQFSDSDKKTAENFGIDYMDVEDFVAELDNETSKL
jgi:DNA 3'-phosphatase